MPILKSLIFSLFCLSVNYATFAQFTLSPSHMRSDGARPDSKLVGRVKTVLSVKELNGSIVESSVDQFDLRFRMTEQIVLYLASDVHTDTSGAQSISRAYLYLGDARKPAQIVTKRNGDEKVVTKFYYDRSHRVVEENFFSRNELVRKTLYNDRPQLFTTTITSITYVNGKSGPAELIDLKYNEAGQWIEKIEYALDHTQRASTRYEYDERGNLAKEIVCCKYNHFSVFKYSYDKHGNWTERVESRFSGSHKNVADLGVTRMYRAISYYSD